MMFPVSLDFALAERVEKQELMMALERRFPEIQFGEESDLMKHSSDWPEAVVAVRHEEEVPYLTSIDFVHFPRRERSEKGDAVMPATKLALLRELSAMFECRVLCGASEFWNKEEVDSRYDCAETFLCLGGRVFSGAVDGMDASLGARPGAGWLPVNGAPVPQLDADATLINEPLMIEEMQKWCAIQSAPPENSMVIYPEGMLAPDDDDFEDDEEANDQSSWGKVDYSSENENFDDEGAGVEDDPEEEMEEYFQQIDQWTDGHGPTASKQLIADGIALPAPGTLNDVTLNDVLWKVIRGLAVRNTYLHGTNHLSDRELYKWMWEDMLNQNTIDFGGFNNAGFHVSPLGTGSEEDVRKTQIYYDDAVSRARWKSSWPNDEIPAHEDPPYDRDRHLPKREGGGWP